MAYSPYFFESIRNTQTGALIEFDMPPAPLREDVLRSVVEDEVDLPPPWGARGFEPAVVLKDESIHLVNGGWHTQNERSLLQARLRGIYDQVDTTYIEKDLIDLANKWNKLDSSTEVEKGRVQKVTEDTIYAVSKKVPGESERSPWQRISDTFLTRLQGLSVKIIRPTRREIL